MEGSLETEFNALELGLQKLLQTEEDVGQLKLRLETQNAQNEAQERTRRIATAYDHTLVPDMLAHSNACPLLPSRQLTQ